MSKIDELNEHRITKLEEEVADMNKTIKVDMKEMRNEMKTCINEGFENCRTVMPLRCEANFKKSKGFSMASIVATGTAICSVIAGVTVFLVKSGLMESLFK